MNPNVFFYWYKAYVLGIVDSSTLMVSFDLGFEIKQWKTITLYKISAIDENKAEIYLKSLLTPALTKRIPVTINTFQDSKGNISGKIYIPQSWCPDETVVTDFKSLYCINRLMVHNGYAHTINA